jgi:predicted RNA-binding protein YlxR (DUF448 family)
MRRKHVPQRTCVGCRQAKAKRDLIRLVHTPEGQLVIDVTGKLNGRGAYLCRQRSCWEQAVTGNQVGKALKIEIGKSERQMLQDFAETL